MASRINHTKNELTCHRNVRVKIFQIILALTSILFLFSACGVNLQDTNLTTALLDEYYQDSFYYNDSSWEMDDWWDEDEILYSQTRGSLPPGVVISANGQIVGTPTAVGNYEFRVTVYSIDEYDTSDFFFDSFDDDYYYDDGVDADSQWFTLFVTERSTNNSCPAPNDESTIETYVCLGSIEADTLAQDETFTLDVSYFINFDNSFDYDIERVAFTIYYDADLFAPVEDNLNSQILREAATRATASIAFDNTVLGELGVVVTAGDKDFHKPGCFIDIPFAALTNIDAGVYDFPIEIDEITSGDNEVLLPANVGINGDLTVTESIEEEVEVEIEIETIEETADEMVAHEDIQES